MRFPFSLFIPLLLLLPFPLWSQPGPLMIFLEEGRTICQGNSVTIRMEIAGGSPPYTIRWDTGDTTEFIQVSPASSRRYRVTVTDRINRSAHDSIDIIVAQLPKADAGRDRTICPGQSTRIGVPGDSTNTYLWTPQDGLDDPSRPDPLASPAATTIYILRVINDNKCIAHDTVTIQVIDPPTAHVLRTSQKTLTAVSPAFAGTYQWFHDGVPLQSATDRTLTIDMPGVYSVRIMEVTGGASHSPPRRIGFDDGVFIPDHYFIYGVIGRDRRVELPLRNSDPGLRRQYIEEILLVEDGLPCDSTPSGFSIIDPMAGLYLDPGDSVPIFINFRPPTSGLKSARLLIRYSDTEFGKRGAGSVSTTYEARIAGMGIADGDYLKTDLTLSPVSGAIPGSSISTSVLLTNGIAEPDNILHKGTGGGRCVPFIIKFHTRKTLLHFTEFASLNGCDTSSLTLYSTRGNPMLHITYRGYYDFGAGDTLEHFSFIPMLGDIDRTAIKLDMFQWMGVDDFYRPTEHYGDTVMFLLQGVCTEGGTRLIKREDRRAARPALRVVPNPASEEITIEYSLPYSESGRIVIYDLFGRMVEMIAVGSNASSIRCNTGNLDIGSYFIVLSGAEGNITERLDITR